MEDLDWNDEYIYPNWKPLYWEIMHLKLKNVSNYPVRLNECVVYYWIDLPWLETITSNDSFSIFHKDHALHRIVKSWNQSIYGLYFHSSCDSFSIWKVVGVLTCFSRIVIEALFQLFLTIFDLWRPGISSSSNLFHPSPSVTDECPEWLAISAIHKKEGVQIRP